MNVTRTSPAANGISDLYNSTGANPVRAAKKNLDSADFMKLLAVQFQSQDPMKPMEDTAFIAQMAQFTSLEQSHALVAEMGRLRADQQILLGNGYLGRTVTVEDDKGKPVTGLVTALENNGDGVRLTIDGKTYPLNSIRRIEPTVPPPSVLAAAVEPPPAS
jgi:flagellar basal-body rod modification protein FlgD